MGAARKLRALKRRGLTRYRNLHRVRPYLLRDALQIGTVGSLLFVRRPNRLMLLHVTWLKHEPVVAG